MPFWIDFCSIFDPNLPPKIHQNRSKIDAKMPSHVELLFWSIFNRFLLPTWTPRTQKIKPPLQGEHDFSKNRFSQVASIFDRFGCQHGFIFASKILPTPPKNRSQDASNFWSIFASMFFHFGYILGPNLEPCWPHFLLKWGNAVGRRPSFCCVYVIFRFFGRPGPLLARFRLDFGGFGPPFWRFFGVHFGGFWSRFGSHVACIFNTF